VFVCERGGLVCVCVCMCVCEGRERGGSVCVRGREREGPCVFVCV
jgi:hypothetical protein